MKILDKSEYESIDGYYRALNYIALGQLYLKDNPLLKKKLEISDIKSRVIGHFGTVPNQNFIYAHLNRIITKNDLNMIYISGPGHGGNTSTSGSYLDGTFSKYYPDVTMDEEGMNKLFKMFSSPYGMSSHASCEVPGSIHEGGELGYSLSHAYGAAIDNKDLIVACCIGDGEAETGPLATSWHLNKIINPKTDGIVLPILNLNGYKIASPTILGRMSNDELYHYFTGLGYRPYLVEGTDIKLLHERMAKVLDMIVKDINYIKTKLKANEKVLYPMLILKMPKGFGAPKKVDNKKIEGTFRAHQVPLLVDSDHLNNLPILEKWFKSYKPEELFDENGSLKEKYKLFIPRSSKCMSNNSIIYGSLYKDLVLPNYKKYALKSNSKEKRVSDMLELSNYIKDVIRLNPNNFLITCPDEALSNRLNNIFEVTNRKWNYVKYDDDEYLDKKGRIVDSILSEHICEGLMEGYNLTYRHGFISSYEAFIKVVSSMMCEHSKWIKMSKEVSFRKPIPSLNYLLTSHVWQQDHNGFTHQNPGFLNDLVNLKSDMAHIYMPFDYNTLLCSFNHVLNTKNSINVIVASKHPSTQYLNIDEASTLFEKGLGVLEFASNSKNKTNLILASSGDTPTKEVIMASKILTSKIPNLKVRVINVIDLMKLKNKEEFSDKEFDRLFTKNQDIIFVFHGYPSLIHELVYERNNKNFHVLGYTEEGSITTPFDMKIRNKIDRYNIILESLKYLEGFTKEKKELIEFCHKQIKLNIEYVKKYGIDNEEIVNLDK